MTFSNDQILTRFSIRKLSIGVASVALCSLFLTNSNSVEAAIPNQEAVTLTQSNPDKPAQASLEVNKKSTSKIKPQANSQTLVSKKVSAKAETNSDLVVKNAKMHEHENVNDNGGYDQDYWGKIDVDDWNYDSINDQKDPDVKILINSYKGADVDHLIIPNSQDFINAGILKKGQKAAIYDLAHLVSQTTISNHPQTFQDGVKNVSLDDLAINNYSLIPKILQKPTGSVGISKTGNSTLTILNNNLGLSKLEKGYSNSIFYGYDKNAILDVSNLDTHNITTLQGAFSDMPLQENTFDLSKWAVSNVTNVHGLFSAESAYGYAHDISLHSWDLRKVRTSEDDQGMIDPLLLFDRGSGICNIYGKLDLSDMKLPESKYTIMKDDGSTLTVDGTFAPFVLRQLAGYDQNTPQYVLMGTKEFDFSGNDFSGLTTDTMNQLNNLNKSDDYIESSTLNDYVILNSNAKYILNDVKNFPELPAGWHINYSKEQTDEFSSKASEKNKTGIKIITNNHDLLKSLGNKNYEKVLEQTTAKRTINFNFPESYLKTHADAERQVIQSVSLLDEAEINNDSNEIIPKTLNENAEFPALSLPTISGYIASGRVDAANAIKHNGDVITINYLPVSNPQTPEIDPAPDNKPDIQIPDSQPNDDQDQQVSSQIKQDAAPMQKEKTHPIKASQLKLARQRTGFSAANTRNKTNISLIKKQTRRHHHVLPRTVSQQLAWATLGLALISLGAGMLVKKIK